jgi:hypothetical protein
MSDFVFSSEECVVCLSDKPTQVFKMCNHCCCCAGCSKKIVGAAMQCPLCRGKIIKSVAINDVVDGLAKGESVPVLADELKSFKERRNEYVAELERACAKNAGFVGKSKLARGVAREMGSELEERQKETKGGERCTSKAEFSVTGNLVDGGNVAIDGNLEVKFKVGRKTYTEIVPFMEWESAKNFFVELIAGDNITTLDMATHYPEEYWLWRYHKKNVEEALQEAGLIQNKRHRS